MTCKLCQGYGWRLLWQYPRTPHQHKASAHVPRLVKVHCLPCRGTGYR